MIHLACLRDHYFFSEAMIAMLKDKNNFKVEFVTYTLADLFYNLNKHNIDLLMLTYENDFDSLKEIVQTIKQHSPVPIIYIQSDRDVKKARDIQKEDVHVYLYKMTALTLLDCMKSVADKYILEKSKQTFIKQSHDRFKLSSGTPSHPFSLLTKNQQKIICMLSQQLERHKIAESCNLSIHSVNTYLYKAKRIIGCLNTKTLLEICDEDIQVAMIKIGDLNPKVPYENLIKITV